MFDGNNKFWRMVLKYIYIYNFIISFHWFINRRSVLGTNIRTTQSHHANCFRSPSICPHEDDTPSGFFVRSLPKFLLYPRGVEISQYCSMDTLMLLIIFYFFFIISWPTILSYIVFSFLISFLELDFVVYFFIVFLLMDGVNFTV